MRRPAESRPVAGELEALARRNGIATSYTDAFGQHKQVSEESLLAVLQALGEPLERSSEAGRLLDAEAAGPAGAERPIPPVVVAWEGELPPLRIGPGEAVRAVTVALALEDGGDGGDLVEIVEHSGETVVRGRARLPFGRHQLVIDRPARGLASPAGQPSRLEEEPDEVTVLSAPRRTRGFEGSGYGAFVPTYALVGEAGDGGHLGLLAQAGELLGGKGASYLATLPLLADIAGERDFPSPYSPLSRLFWHEGFLDASRLPELAGLLEGASLPRGATARARALRPHLGAAEERLRAAGGERLAAYEAYLVRRPEVLDYAAYRAACEERGADRSAWPERWRRGLIDDRDVPEEARAAHRYAQFALESQLEEVRRQLAGAGTQLVLDLPIGCRADGYDPWAFPESFAVGVRIGAPPDRFFTGGQDWGFPPLIPAAERASGYAVTTACVRNLLAHCGSLRIDHALGLSRLWWIPAGMEPTEGAYVSYPTEELLALYCLEAWRAGASLVGENLGTVEESLTSALREHGIAGMSVAVFTLEDEEAHPMEPLSVPPGTVAFVDTHDTATFAAWYTGHDIEVREALGLAAREEAAAERAARKRAAMTLSDRLVASELITAGEAGDPVAVHAGLLEELGRSSAELVLVNLEDCWGELEAQNLPGTGIEQENFSRPIARPVQLIDEDTAVTRAFAALKAGREEARAIGKSDGGY